VKKIKTLIDINDSTINIQKATGFISAENEIIKAQSQAMPTGIQKDQIDEFQRLVAAASTDNRGLSQGVFDKYHTPLFVKNQAGVDYRPYPLENNKEFATAPLDLVAARKYILAYTILNHLGLEHSRDVKGLSIYDMDSRGDVEYYFGAQNYVYNNFRRITACNRPTVEKVLRNAAHHNNIGRACACGGDPKTVCSHFEQLVNEHKIDLLVCSHCDSFITSSMIIWVLSKGIPIIYIGHTFSEMVSGGEFGMGRWREATWKRVNGKILFNVIGRRTYYTPEFFNYMRYTFNYGGEFYGITKTLEFHYGSFEHMGLIIDPFKRQGTSVENIDLPIYMNFDDLISFKYDNCFCNEQVCIMDKNTTLSDMTKVIAQDGSVAFVEATNDKDQLQPTLLKNIRGKIHFAEFSNTDITLFGYITGIKDKRYCKGFFSEYFGLHKFADQEHSFSVSLEKYNAMVSELLVSDIDEDTIYAQVADCLKSHFKFSSDPTLPILLIRSAVIDVARVIASVKGLRMSAAYKLYEDVKKIRDEKGLMNACWDGLFPGNKKINPKDFLNGSQAEQVFGLSLNSKIYNPDFDVSPLVGREKETFLRWQKENPDNCAIPVVTLALVHALNLEEQDPFQYSTDELLATILPSIKNDDAEVANMVELVWKGTQPTEKELRQLLSYLLGDFRWIRISDDQLDHGGTTGFSVIFSRGHVDIATSTLVIGESL
jgi:hypothetical protein